MASAARVMRLSGLDPDTVTWHLNDLNPVAVALSGVNAVTCGLTRVVLTCENALARPTADQ